MDINLAMKKCFDNDIKVYPSYINATRKWYVIVNIDGLPKRIPKEVSKKNVNESIKKTYIYYASKI